MYRVLIDTEDGLAFDGIIAGPTLAEVQEQIAALNVMAGPATVIITQFMLVVKVYDLHYTA